MRKRFISAVASLILCAYLFISIPPLAVASEATQQRPNIVLIMCDDMGYSDVGCYGGEIRTPNIDRLAREGLRFRQFYNNAKCTTTRASVVTGLYPRRSGSLLKENMVTIADVVKRAGYSTAISGKWHLGNSAPNRPSDRGFDHYYGLLDGCCNYFDPAMPDPSFKGGRIRYFAQDDRRITSFPDGFYTTDAFTDYAVEMIDRFVDLGKPFFLHVCYTAPHYPLHAKPEDIARYQGHYLMGWEELRKQRHQRQIAMGLVEPEWDLPGPGPEVQPWAEAPNKDWQDLRMAVYAAMVDRADQGIGRILQKLDRSGVADNTVVIFLSDNGGCAERPGGEDPTRIPGPKEHYTACGPGWAYAQNTPFRRYKQWVHEGGISTPFIVCWPGVVSPNSLTNEVGHIIDLLPTCADMANAEYPHELHGKEVLPCEGLSLVPIFKGGVRVPHDRLYWEWSGNRAVREGHWKLCWDRTVKTWELYDVVADRTEMHDLADKFPERVKDLSEKWFAWANQTGVKVARSKKKK